ncbi:MAG: metallophosphoesterase [Firmicutes bacterium]|nr:metallophosphoesterase [Bacillota bacterium]
MRAKTWKRQTKVVTALMALSFIFVGLLLPMAATGCPLFVNEEAEFLTDLQVTPLNVNIDYLSDEHHQAMPVFTVASNQAYSLKIDFDLKDATTTIFLKILRCGNESFPEIYRIALPPDQLIAGRNSIVVNLPAPEETGMNEASLYMIKTIAVAGHADTPDWKASFSDGLFAGRTPEELDWDNFEVAYQITAKVGGEYHNPFIKNLSLTPDKTTLTSGEGLSVGARYYRTYWCPSDYFKFLAKNEQTGEVVELGRWAAPYWQMVTTGWQTFSKNLTAPSKPGTYIVKAVGCSGHGTYTYYGVNWNDPRSDGDFKRHKPEELNWDFYEIASDFRITVTEEWSFVVITDLHIGRNYLDYDGLGFDDVGAGEDYYLTERLKKAVRWVNDNCNAKKIKFVAVLGDLSENGQRSEMRKAKETLDGLEIPYFPVIGNHDVWSRFNYVKDSHTGEIKRSDPVAEGDRYFKEIFNEEFYRQQFEKLGVTQWDFDQDTRFHNYSFVYKGVKFIGLDFIRRDTDSPSGGVVHESSKEWLEKHLYTKNTRAILCSHHAMFKDKWKGCEDVHPIEAILQRASEDFGTEALANFAGHVHSTYDEYLKVHYPVYYKDNEINKDWSEDESTPAGIPVVTTEALVAASNMDGPKGCLRLVNVKNNEDIDFHRKHNKGHNPSPSETGDSRPQPG